MFKKLSIAFVALCSIHSFAQDEKNWGADISLSTQHQEFEIVSADMETLDFSPWVMWGDWTISASVPWLKIDGDYFVNGGLPRVVSFCQRLDGLSPQILQRLVTRGRITQTQIDRCDNLNDAIAEREQSQSGLGDMSIDLEYRHYWDTANTWWTAVSAAYKHDNGDVQSSIGSGSRDTTLGLALGYEGVKWFSHLDYTHTSVSPTDTPFIVDDYASLGFGFGYNLLDNLTWGLDYQQEEAYLQSGEDIDLLSSYLHWGMTDSWSMTLVVSDYDSAAEYPQSEYSAQITYSF